MKTLLEYLNGKVSPRELIETIVASNQDISTSKKRFDLLMKLEWITWSSQTWNLNFSNCTFEEYAKAGIHYFHPDCDSYSAIWVKTGNY